MREIKFRAWDKLRKEMSPVDALYQPFGGAFQRLDVLKSGRKIEDEAILMQFTGLKDRDGNDIYEGDILQEDDEYTSDVVEWCDFECGFATREWFSSRDLAKEAETLEIIGNIYENPELLDAA